MTYFNTTSENGQQLQMFVNKSKKQDDVILRFFQTYNDKAISPSEVWVNCFDVDSIPITSIRRSISVLTKKGKLLKTEIKDKGIYGRDEYKWRLKK